jgi:hypothetical protein
MPLSFEEALGDYLQVQPDATSAEAAQAEGDQQAEGDKESAMKAKAPDLHAADDGRGVHKA